MKLHLISTTLLFAVSAHAYSFYLRSALTLVEDPQIGYGCSFFHDMKSHFFIHKS